jgi:hypothetical protein
MVSMAYHQSSALNAVIGELDQVGLVELTDKLATEIWGRLGLGLVMPVTQQAYFLMHRRRYGPEAMISSSRQNTRHQRVGHRHPSSRLRSMVTLRALAAPDA